MINKILVKFPVFRLMSRNTLTPFWSTIVSSHKD